MFWGKVRASEYKACGLLSELWGSFSGKSGNCLEIRAISQHLCVHGFCGCLKVDFSEIGY